MAEAPIPKQKSDKKHDAILALLKQNQLLIEENIKLSKRLRRHQIFSSLWGWFKIAVLVGFIVFSAIFVPRWISTQIDSVKSSFGGDSSGSLLEKLGVPTNLINPQEVLEQFGNQQE